MKIIDKALALFGKKSNSFHTLMRDFGIPIKNFNDGVPLTTDQALAVTSVWRACSVIAEGIAQVPWEMRQRQPNGDTVPLPGHWLTEMLDCAPNSIQTSFEFRETIGFHLALNGNAFVFLNRVGNERRPRTLLPIEPSRVSVTRDKETDDITYEVRFDGQLLKFDAEQIWHIKGPSWSPEEGMPPVRLARRAIALALSAEKSQDSLFSNGIQTSGVLSVDGTLSEENFQKLSKYLETQFQKDNAGRALILDNGAKWSQMTMNASDAEQIETRKFQIEEVARAFGVFPVMLMQSDKASTFASAQEFRVMHVTYTLGPWYARLENSLKKYLLTPAERRDGVFSRFDANHLMRGASRDRADFYSRALGSGGGKPWLTPNEVRRMEGMNSIDGGDDLAMPQQQPQGINENEDE